MANEADEERKKGLKKRSGRAAVISVVGLGMAQVLRAGNQLLIAPLLSPEVFGLMAYGRWVNNGLEMLSDVGIHASITVHKRTDRGFLDTAWTLKVIRGFILFVVGALTAIPFAMWYEPALIYIIPAVAFATILRGFNSTKLHQSQRELAQGRATATDLASQVAAIVVMVALAFIYRNVWALVAGMLVQAAVRMWLTFAAFPGAANSFRMDRSAARDIVSFGKWIFLSSMLSFLAQRFDVLVLGKLIPLSVLGVYSMAVIPGRVATMLSSRVTESVFLPALAEMYRDDPERMEVRYRAARAAVLPAALVMVVGAALAAPAFFEIVMDHRYHDAGWMAQLTMVSVWFGILINLGLRGFLATGESRPLAAVNVIQLLLGPAGAAVGYQLFGVGGFIVGAAAGPIAAYGMLSYMSLRNRLGTLRLDVALTATGLACALGAHAGSTYLLEIARSWPRLIAGNVCQGVVLIGMAVWAGTTLRNAAR